MRLEDAADYALKQALKKAEWAEARAEAASGDSFFVKNGNPEAAGLFQTTGLAVRVLAGGRLTAAFTNRLTPAGIRDTVRIAVKAGRAARPAARTRLSEEKIGKASYKVSQKKKLADVSPEEKLELLLDADAEAARVKEVAARVLSISTGTSRKYYADSEGTEIRAETPRAAGFYLLLVGRNRRSEQRIVELGGSGGWEVVEKWGLDEKVGAEARLLRKILREAKPAPRGELDLVVSPEIVGIACHESVGHPYEADRVLGREAAQAGESFITPASLGMRIGSRAVTVADDPTLAGSYGYYLYDDEGVRARPRLLIKDGAVNEFLHNRETAAEFGLQSNAAARANSWAAEPIVRMANTFLVPGSHSFEELVEGVKKGVYVASYTEWNIDDKRWNQRYVGVEAYEIRNGRLGRLVRRPVVETTTPGFWQAVDAVGDRAEFSAGTCGKGDPGQGIPVWFGGPAARLRKVKLA